MFNHDVILAIKEDAIGRYPEESCGVVLRRKDGTAFYYPMQNIAEDPLKSFRIDESKLAPIMESVIAVVHSHPNGPDCPSETDMRQQLALGVPFGIVTTDGVGCFEPFFWGDGTPKAPLIGRGFRHGVTDCYALIKDHFDVNLGIKLGEYPRDWEWWDSGQKLYEDHFALEGFSRIDENEVKEHDCFLAQIRSDTPNHAGVYVGGNLILHHLTARLPADASRLSRREPIGSWSKFICGFWVRHKDLF